MKVVDRGASHPFKGRGERCQQILMNRSADTMRCYEGRDAEIHQTEQEGEQGMTDPRWTGAAGEYAVVVSRGEPRRIDSAMRMLVNSQAQRYLERYGGAPDEAVVVLALELVAADYIDAVGAQGVSLTREHLLRYVEVAKRRLDDVAASIAALQERLARVQRETWGNRLAQDQYIGGINRTLQALRGQQEGTA